MRRALLLLPLILVPVALAGGAKPPRLALPYGLLVDHKGRVFIADAGRHHVFRYDAHGDASSESQATAGPEAAETAGRLCVRGSGRSPRSPRTALDSCMSLTSTTVSCGASPPEAGLRPWRASRESSGSTSTQAGRYLAIASIERGVMRLDLSTETLETLVPVGQGVDGPHGLRYDASGDLWVADPGSQGRVIRIDHSSGKLIEVARVSTATVLPTGRGVYVTVGSGSGGRVLLIRPDGGRRTVVGTGRISRQRNGVRATRVGILPTALALARNGSLLVAQAKPVPALRRVSRAGIITTVTR